MIKDYCFMDDEEIEKYAKKKKIQLPKQNSRKAIINALEDAEINGMKTVGQLKKFSAIRRASRSLPL